MRCEEVLRILAENRGKLGDFAVSHIAVFGSVARNEATDTSDVDILVEFDSDAVVGLFRFIRLKHFLEDSLACPVDLITPEMLRKEMKNQILKEAIRAA